MLNVSATQEQQRIIEAQQARIEALEAERVDMFEILHMLEARLHSLESSVPPSR